MHTLTDIHQQFAEAFEEPSIRPLAYLLSQKLMDGNICVTEEDINVLGPSTPYHTTSIPGSKALPLLISEDPKANVPFIKQGDRYYFQRYFRYERNILEKLGDMMKRSAILKEARLKELSNYKDIFSRLAANYDLEAEMSEPERIDWQLVAALQAQLHDFFIITGGPGTGKTTTLAKLLRILLAIHPNYKIALAAPTGKASMRMAESLKRSTENFPKLFTPEIKETIQSLPYSTLHKLLEFIPESIYFKRNEEKPLEEDIIIIDEASMVDVPMFSKLLNALKPGARLILLGDKDQLASVEAGSLLGDLCRSVAPLNQFDADQVEWINGFIDDDQRKITNTYINANPALLSQHIVELKYSHRFKEQGEIGKLSKAVISGKTDVLETIIKNPAQNLAFDLTYEPNTLERFVEGYKTYLEQSDIKAALKALNEIRVLTTVRQGERGLYMLNKKIEQLLEAKGWIDTGKVFYENRPIIITRNNYDLDLYNGDIGIVRIQNEVARVWFEGKEGEIRSVLPAYITDCETVFAMTIHKSQGSEFTNVMVILPEGTKNQLLTRELLYTGITRTKEKGMLIVSGTLETINHTLETSVKRISGIGTQIKTITA